MLKCTTLCVNHFKRLPTTLLSNTMDVISQQTRNTFILKRMFKPGLHRKNYRPHTLKAKHFIYKLVEDTNMRKQPEIDMILTQDVQNIGHLGDRIQMKPEKAYYNLLLPQLAVYATPENIEKYNAHSQTKKCLYSSVTAEQTLNQLSTFYLSVEMSLDKPWILEKWHMRANFRKSKFHVPEHAITMPEKPISGPDLSIEGKQFYVTVTINNRDQVKVRCIINHYTFEQKRKIETTLLPWEQPCVAIFPEDQPILDSLPKYQPNDKMKNKNVH